MNNVDLTLSQKFQLFVYDMVDGICDLLPIKRKPSVAWVVMAETGDPTPRKIESDNRQLVIDALTKAGYKDPAVALESFELLSTINFGSHDPR